MDSFELNKIIGALLGTCIVVLVTSFAAGAMFAPHMPEKPGFEIAVKEAAHGGPAEAAAPSEPIEKLLQTASARRSTWTIIGTPAMSRSGLPGSRVAAMRAGISTRVRFSVIGRGVTSGVKTCRK